MSNEASNSLLKESIVIANHNFLESVLRQLHISSYEKRNTLILFSFLGSPVGEGCASLGSSARPRRRARGQVASYQAAPPPRKIRLISWGSMSLVSDIKLIRTDTTLDLSQKAEKGMKMESSEKGLYTKFINSFRQPIWD